MIVEFDVAIIVQNQPMAVGPDRGSLPSVGNGGMSFGPRVFQERHQRHPRRVNRRCDSGQLAESGKQINRLHHRVALPAAPRHPRRPHDQR